MLIAGAINFVVFISRRNDYHRGGTLQRMVTSIREVNGVDGRVLSTEVFAGARTAAPSRTRPIACMRGSAPAGYRPYRPTRTGVAGDRLHGHRVFTSPRSPPSAPARPSAAASRC